MYAAFLVSRFRDREGDRQAADNRQVVPAEVIAQLAATADELLEITRRTFALTEPGMVDNADQFVQIARVEFPRFLGQSRACAASLVCGRE